MKKILIVDDEEHVLKITSIRLKANGYAVITAKDGKEALKQAKLYEPDLIILDIMMPGMSGDVVADELKHIPRLSKIPIIFSTCLVKEGEQNNIIGGRRFLAKPFDADKLITTVQEMTK